MSGAGPEGPSEVLVVDDDDASRLTLAALLEDDGHRVHEAATLDEARELLAERAFDLVLVDYNLEEGLGTELLPAARSCAGAPVFVVVSGDAEVAKLPGVDGALLKGDDPRRALQRIKTWLGRGPKG